jgi:hypothetical protein
MQVLAFLCFGGALVVGSLSVEAGVMKVERRMMLGSRFAVIGILFVAVADLFAEVGILFVAIADLFAEVGIPSVEVGIAEEIVVVEAVTRNSQVQCDASQ